MIYKRYNQGKFSPQNPHKYKGDNNKIFYRSGWELKLFKYLDCHPKVVWWSSEELIIPYLSPVDNKIHRYFVDVVVELKKKDGTKETLVIEVKPASQTKPPKKSKNTNKMINEQVTYMVNQAKWSSARAFCDMKGWKFVILTEKELGIK